MDTDLPSIFWFVIAGFVVPAVLLQRAFVSPSDRQLHRWAHRCRVTLTPANEALVRSHLGRVRRFRSIAAFPFWWLATVPLVAPAGFAPEWATVWPALVAYVTGSLVAELTGDPIGSDSLRHASLSPRTIGDYLPPWMRALPWTLFAVAAVLLIVRPFIATPADLTRPWLVLVAMVGLATLAELVARRIVGRPQRSGDPDVLAADDGLRATAVSMTAGVAVVAGLSAGYDALSTFPVDQLHGWSVFFVVWLLLQQALLIGVISCVVGQDTWGYRPRHHRDGAASAS